MRLLAALAVALVFAAPAAAATSVKVPAPAVGNVRVEMLTIKASSTPKFTVLNASALGKGFGAVALVGKTKAAGTYLAYVVMFMGNAGGASPASTMNLQLTGGAPAGSPKDDTKDCKVLKPIYDNDYRDLEIFAAIIHLHFIGESTYEEQVHNDLMYAMQQSSCK